MTDLPEYRSKAFKQFVADMEDEGFDVEHYEGRHFYKGPAVRTSREDGIDKQDVIRATDVRLQFDNLGLDWICYPATYEAPE